MHVGLLGPLQVDGAEPSGLAPRERRVLAALAQSPGSIVSHGSLERLVWAGDAPSTARKVLQHCVSVLRRRYGLGRIRTAPDGYAIELGHDDVDASVFEREAGRGRLLLDQGMQWAAADVLTAAIVLWRGDALVEIRDTEDGALAAHRLDESRLAAQDDLTEARLACGEHLQLVAQLRDAVGAEPLRERRWAQLMLALHRSGQQAEALAAFQALREHLGTELGIEPGHEVVALEEAILLDAPELRLGPTSRHVSIARSNDDPGERSSNLPQGLASFIGREGEVGAAVAALASARFVTIVGPGGSGKSRLALEVGSRLVRQAMPAWLVDLAPLRSEDSAYAALAMVLCPRVEPSDDPLESVARTLAGRDLVLVLDNCEHLLDAAAAAVETLLSRCPGLRVLATSQEALSVGGEIVQRLLPLSLPPPDAPDEPDVLLAYEAIQLFVDRSSAQRADFILDHETSPAVRRICERLDGIPLAIELAAARTGSMSVADIEFRLSDRFSLLTSGSRTAQARQRTLDAAIRWSFELLGTDEQRALCALSVFSGSFLLDGAEAVVASVAPHADATRLVIALADKSLLECRKHGGTTRYQLLESVREFAANKLGELEVAVAADAVRRRLGYLAERWRADDPLARFRKADDLRWHGDDFELDKSDLSNACEIALHEPEVDDRGIALATAFARGLFSQGDHRLFNQVAGELAEVHRSPLDAHVAVAMHNLVALWHHMRGEGDRFVARTREALLACDRGGGDIEESATLYRLSGVALEVDQVVESVRDEVLARSTRLASSSEQPAAVALARAVRALVVGGSTAVSRSDADLARRDFELALDYCDRAGLDVLAWIVRQTFSHFELTRGELVHARELAEECVGELDESSPGGRWAAVLLSLSTIDALADEVQRSATACLDALSVVVRQRLDPWSSNVAGAASLVLHRGGSYASSCRALGLVTGLLERHDQRPDPFDVGILDDLRRTLRRDLGANAFDRIVIEWRDAYLTEVAAALSDDLRALVTARP